MSGGERYAFYLFEWCGVEGTVVILKYVGLDGAAPPLFPRRGEIVLILEWMGRSNAHHCIIYLPRNSLNKDSWRACLKNLKTFI